MHTRKAAVNKNVNLPMTTDYQYKEGGCNPNNWQYELSEFSNLLSLFLTTKNKEVTL